MSERLHEAVARVRERTSLVPRVALVIGQGFDLGGDLFSLEARVDLPEIGADVAVALGRIEGVPVAVHSGSSADGGVTVREAGLPVRVSRLLGAEVLVLTGVCRALDPSLVAGDLVVVEDHLNLLGENPLVGPNEDELGPRFPDMTEPYDPILRRLAREAAAAAGARLGGGVYAAIPDANLLAAGEYVKLRQLGARLVGPGVVPEVIAARHMGMRVLAMLAVAADSPSPSGPGVGPVLRELVKRLGLPEDPRG